MGLQKMIEEQNFGSSIVDALSGTKREPSPHEPI